MSIIKNNLVGFLVADGGEKGELKMKATPTMLLKTHVEKMSVWATPTIFMKTTDLSRDSHDIYENKGSCASEQTGRKHESMRKETALCLARANRNC